MTCFCCTFTVGERREYYQDNKEDAILMTYFAALDE